MSQTAAMDVPEESDSGVVPTKGPNKEGGSASAEDLEGRPLTKENTEQTPLHRTLGRAGAPRRESRGLLGVREAAQRDKQMRFTALLHHVTVAFLRDSFYALKREAAPGIDGVTWQEYETDLEARLLAVHERVHRGTYRAQPAKRVYIAKADGRQRPLGMAVLDDKLVQHAVVRVLTEI